MHEFKDIFIKVNNLFESLFHELFQSNELVSIQFISVKSHTYS